MGQLSTQLTIAGHLTADPELRFTNKGIPVANFTVAVNERTWDSKNEEWLDGDPCFIRCNLWNQQAENITDSLHKGDRIIASGVLKQRNWETDKGEKRTTFELLIDEIGASLRYHVARPEKPAHKDTNDKSDKERTTSRRTNKR